MALLIDGYNLLHGTDLLGAGRKAGTLEGSRNALLRFVLSTVDAAELPHTTIVFDAKEAPPGLPRVRTQRGLTIRFHADADELLEELIQAEPAPRRLIVVSSDHRVQRAARRRRATFIDSHQWYFDMKHRALRADASADAKPEGPLSPEEVADLLREFDCPQQDEEASLPVPSEPATQAVTSQSPPPKRRIRGPRRVKLRPSDKQDVNLANPFPPGYAEDLLKGEGQDH